MRRRGRMTGLSGGLLVSGALLAGVVGPALSAAAEPSVYALPGQWRDDGGHTLTLEALQGKRVAITMAYTSCNRICPVTFQWLNDLQERADQAHETLDIVVVSYDPKNDTPESWAAFRKKFHYERPNWHFLSGTERDTRLLARMLGLSDYWSMEDHVFHDFGISMVDGEGHIVQRLKWEGNNRPISRR